MNSCNFNELTNNASKYLEERLFRSKKNIKSYKRTWTKLKFFLEANNILSYNRIVGDQYILEMYNNARYCDLSNSAKQSLRHIDALSEFQETGKIFQRIPEKILFDGEIGQLMAAFVAFKISSRVKETTLYNYKYQLSKFNTFLKNIEISSAKQIDQLIVMEYISSIDSRFPSSIHDALKTLKGFLNYLFANKEIERNISLSLPRENYKKSPKVPSTYSEEEIDTMINSIDLEPIIGKRNRAILLVVSRLGLRTSDIVNLKFENFNWDNSTITIKQFKTGKILELPILPAIGDSIINYLKYGRPKSKEPFIFLSTQSPYKKLEPSSLRRIVHNSLQRAGIKIKDRKSGPHALRHSLAQHLLAKGTVLPVISEILGHVNSESTRLYLRVDLKTLRQCALEVPPITTTFYIQQGGYFYA